MIVDHDDDNDNNNNNNNDNNDDDDDDDNSFIHSVHFIDRWEPPEAHRSCRHHVVPRIQQACTSSIMKVQSLCSEISTLGQKLCNPNTVLLEKCVQIILHPLKDVPIFLSQ